jgi:hypothetical protein
MPTGYGVPNGGIESSPERASSIDDVMSRYEAMKKFFGSPQQAQQLPIMPPMQSAGTGPGAGVSSGIGGGVNIVAQLANLWKMRQMAGMGAGIPSGASSYMSAP